MALTSRVMLGYDNQSGSEKVSSLLYIENDDKNFIYTKNYYSSLTYQGI